MTPSAPLTAGELPEHGLYAGRGEGLLDTLTEQQTRDLFAYLRSTQPLVVEAPR